MASGRLVRVLGVCVLCALALGAVAPAPRAETLNHAAIIVVYEDHTDTLCVAFAEADLSGVELLRRAGLSVIGKPYAGIGEAVCKIGGVGCDFPGEECWCRCMSSPCIFWSYWYWEGGQWVYSGMGASSRRVSNGGLDAWVWGDGKTKPPVVSFESICAQATATPSPTTAPPTSTPTVSPTPSLSPTVTQTPVYSPTPSHTPTITATATRTATATHTPQGPTPTHTPDSGYPNVTNTPAQPGATDTPWDEYPDVPTYTPVPSSTSTPTLTHTPTPGASPTATHTATQGPSPTPSRTLLRSLTPTSTVEETPAPTGTTRPTEPAPDSLRQNVSPATSRTPTAVPLILEPSTPESTPALGVDNSSGVTDLFLGTAGGIAQADAQNAGDTRAVAALISTSVAADRATPAPARASARTARRNYGAFGALGVLLLVLLSYAALVQRQRRDDSKR